MRLAAISATWVTFCVALTGCGYEGARFSSEQHEVVNGTVDDQDPAVVALVTDEEIRCTGVVVSKRIVVTAAHCVANILDIGRLSVFFGQSLELSDQLALRDHRPIFHGFAVGVLDVRVHEGFSTPQLENDIALLLLASDVQVEQVPLLHTPFDDSFIGKQVRVVGFGAVGQEDEAPLSKHQGTAEIAAYLDTTFALVPDPSITCSGDSGGPALLTIDGTEYLAGVLTLGDCATQSVETRIDTYVTEFLDPYIDATEPGAAGTGDLCFYPGNCAMGTCLPATDAPTLSFCSVPCGNDHGCMAPLFCRDGYCRHQPPSPGAIGTSCAASYECESRDIDEILLPGMCLRRASGGDRVCTVECVPNLVPCPSGFSCEDSEIGNEQACFPPDGCGCQSGGPGDAVLPFCLLLILHLGRRSRRRRAR